MLIHEKKCINHADKHNRELNQITHNRGLNQIAIIKNASIDCNNEKFVHSLSFVFNLFL